MARNVRVLLAEDSKDDAELVLLELSRAGFEVEWERVQTADAFREALARSWDLVISDFYMPHFRATEALAELKRRAIEIPFIIVSGSISDEIAVAALKAGANDYVLKGNLVRLVPIVERELREAQHHHEHLRVQRELKETEDRFRLMADQAPVLIWVTDAAGELRYLNKPWLDFIGQKSEREFREEWLDAIHPADRPMALEAFRLAVTHRRAMKVECRARRYDGQFRWILCQAIPRKLEDGAFAGMIGSAVDISERKLAEESLLKSNQALTQFAFVASHDLQEPLRTITNYVQMLERRCADALDESAREYMGFVLSGAERMRLLIRDLLEYSRLEDERPRLQLIDCNLLVESVLDSLKATLRQERADVVCEPLPIVKAAPDRLCKVFANLIDNSVKFRGGRQPRVRIHAEKREGFWTFFIADNGAGIEMEYAERIFRVFQRLHTSDIYPGTGVGLALARKIIEQHGGRLWLESSTIDEGAVFCFTLPEAAEEAGLKAIDATSRATT